MDLFEFGRLDSLSQREIIKEWFDKGKDYETMSHMFVILDFHFYRIYPAYIHKNDDVYERYWEWYEISISRDVNEVYSFKDDFESQIFGKRAWNFS